MASLRSTLRRHHRQAQKLLQTRHPHAVAFFKKRGLKPGEIRKHAARALATGALTGTLLLSAPNIIPALAGPVKVLSPVLLQQELAEQLKSLLPPTVGQLTGEQETKISDLLETLLGITARAELDGNRLNQSYGYIGAEQHLPRFPGDTVAEHGQFIASGITPGLGAWGYFANSRNELTPDLVEKEKYYVAVQTLYLPDWHARFRELRDWYKWRKVVVVNPASGKAIVAVVADSGPASWTGKHFGGSPEVMAYLGLNVGKQKGPVVLFFVDDPDNKVPLGPLEYNVQRGGAPIVRG